MKFRVLGSGAGGGVPQWNCHCENCRLARRDSGTVRPRTQSSLAVSASGDRWILVNASPDLRDQINQFSGFHPVNETRGTTIERVVLTDAEIDHASGLLFTREAGDITLHTTRAVREHLNGEFDLLPTLKAFSDIDWNPIQFEEPFVSFGVTDVVALPVNGSPPTYSDRESARGDTIGLEFRRRDGTVSALYLPALAELTPDLKARIGRCDVLFLDGTFWSDNELASVRESDRLAGDMGHLPVGGPEGSLRQLENFTGVRKIYVHVNNTNPILRNDSPERQRVKEAGFEVAHDGLTVTL